MTGSIVTAMATSFKVELFSAGHCFNATVTPTGSVASGSTSVTGVSSMIGVAVGMTVTATGIPTNTVVANITSATAFTLSQAATAPISNSTLTIAGDLFKMALIVPTMNGTYSAADTNYTDITYNSDEVSGSGTGYTTTGAALTNVSAISGGTTTAYINFSPNPSWTSATFSTAGCMIYNSSTRDGGLSGLLGAGNTTGGGRCCSVHSFGGTQTVSAGTFTVLMPSASSTNAILRLQ